MERNEVVVVTGATGRQGGAVLRHLVADGWRVRALTRTPASDAARRLAGPGVEVMAADMDNPGSLDAAFGGAHGVYSVQNPFGIGVEAEIRQGRHVAEAARRAGVRHLVQGAAGPGVPDTGVGSWDSKVAIVDHARSLGLPLTVLRPMAFMELMTDKDFYPQASTWHVMPKLMGEDRPVSWLSADDLGAIAARAFADPDAFVGADLSLAADLRSIRECRDIWRSVAGRAPRAFPMPVWLFERFVGEDLPTMWRWLRTHDVPVDPAETRDLLPTASTVEEWVSARVAAAAR